MHSKAELTNYINAVFVKQIWSAGQDLLGNNAISELSTLVDNQVDYSDGLRNPSFNLKRPPGAMATRDGVRIKIPARGKHNIKTDIHLSTIFLPDPSAEVDFSMEIDVDRGGSQVEIDAKVDLDGAIGEIAEIFGVSGDLEETLQQEIDGIGGFDHFRFNERISPIIPPLTRIMPRNHGHAGIDASHQAIPKQAPGFIDIVIVADGYSDSTIHRFHERAQQIADFFDSDQQFVPLKNFKSNIRLWQMPVIVSDPNKLDNRMIASVRANGRTTLNFTNLALVAEVGIQASNQLWRHPLIVFVSDKVSGRANCQGPYVLMDEGSPNLGSLLVHEPGHSNIGRYLADEYIGSGNRSKRYRGLEPAARNVTVSSFYQVFKWARWGPSEPKEGAYEHGKGIFSYQAKCKMRGSSESDPFCPICREELTLGMLDWGHENVQHHQTKGMVVIKATYQDPFKTTTTAQSVGGRSSSLFYSPYRASVVRLKMIASSVSEPWQIRWGVIDKRGKQVQPNRVGAKEIEFVMQEGYQVDVQVAHLSAGEKLTTLTDDIETIGQFKFDQLMLPSNRELRVPVDIGQSIDVGRSLVPRIDFETGQVAVEEALLFATAQGFEHYPNLHTALEFELTSTNGFLQRFKTEAVESGVTREWAIFDKGMLPAGRYKWRVRAIWEEPFHEAFEISEWINGPINSSLWAFQISSLLFQDEASPPSEPFTPQFVALQDDVVLHCGTISVREPALIQASVHPNDKPIKFEYQITRQGTDLDGEVSETRWLKRDHIQLNSVAIIGTIPLSGFDPGIYQYRIRAVDQEGLASGWVIGRVEVPDAQRLQDQWEQFEEAMLKLHEAVGRQGWPPKLGTLSPEILKQAIPVERIDNPIVLPIPPALVGGIELE